MIVKVCGITNEEDALAAVDAGASALGFNFYPLSPRYLPPSEARVIAERVSAVLRVGIFVRQPIEEIERIMTEAGMDIAQVYVGALPPGVRTWRARAMDPTFQPADLDDPAPEAFLLDAPTHGHGGSGRTFDWRRVPTVGRKIVLAGGLDASNVGRAIAIAKPWGVDACSKLESAPGRKDHKRVRDFIEAALAAVHV